MDEIEAITTDLDALLAQVRLRCSHDEATGTVRYGGYDHAAGAGGAVAVPHGRRLRGDLAGACGSTAPIGEPPGRARLVVRAAWILLYLVVLGSFGFLLFLTGETAINEIQQLAQTLSVQDEWRLPVWLEGSSFQQTLVARLPPPSSSSKQLPATRAARAAGHTRLHAGHWQRCERRARHSVLEHLLEHQSDPF
jgi:hypothetical protein